jgi:imidazolonepropionase-like amidohydrolase
MLKAFTRVVGIFLCLAGPALAQNAPAPERITLVRCGTLLAVPGKEPRKNVTVVVVNDKIESVLDGLHGPDLDARRQARAKIKEVDLHESYVLPGLIDCHVHITDEWDATRQLRRVVESDADATVHGVTYCKRTLEAGFTTVRDLGADGDSIFALRRGVERGDIVGPRIVCAGKAVSITGGHMDPTNGYRSDVWGTPGTEVGVADGPDECMKAVRTQIKRGADVIKIAATGGVLSISTAGLAQHFTDPEMEALVKAAHAMGRKVAAHAHGTDGINAALRAGCDSIEHASFQNDESIRLFKEKGAYYVPTLLAGHTTSMRADIPGYYLPMVARKAKEVAPMMMQSFKKAHEAGVKIAFGTDSGVSPHGENAQEFALMVQGGMTPMEAIRAATVSAADLLGVSQQAGTVEPGKSADLIAVKGDPLKDVTELERVNFVMRAGNVNKGMMPR